MRLMNAFGKSLEHTVVSGEPDELGARAHLDRSVVVHFASDFPKLTGFPSPGRLLTIAKELQKYDLILTYNWGAMDVVMAHMAFSFVYDLPPLIHHEDGFNEDEISELKPRRNWYRGMALDSAHAVVVPSQVLEEIALKHWKCSPSRLARIANGIDTKRFAKRPDPGALRVLKRPGEKWVGTLAGLRPVKQLPRLVEAFADLDDHWHLVIVGEGPEKERIRAEADRLQISHRVHLPGAIADPAKVVGLFDIFALSSDSEQFPLSVVEAMAAGLPIAAPNVGDVKAILAQVNRPYVAQTNSAAALGGLLFELADDAGKRKEIGQANREKAQAEFDEAQMIEAYRTLYFGSLKGT